MCVHAGWCGRAVQRLEAQQAASKFPFIGQILVPAFHLGARARRLARESAAVQRLEAQQAEALSALAPALGGSQPPDGAEQQQLPGAKAACFVSVRHGTRNGNNCRHACALRQSII